MAVSFVSSSSERLISSFSTSPVDDTQGEASGPFAVSFVIVFSIASLPAGDRTIFGLGRNSPFNTSYMSCSISSSGELQMWDRAHVSGADRSMGVSIPTETLCLLTVRFLQGTGGDATEVSYDARLSYPEMIGGPFDGFSDFHGNTGSADLSDMQQAVFAARPADTGADFLDCDLSRVFVFNRNFTDSEHDDLFNGGAIRMMGNVLRTSGLEPPTAGWKFFETTGSVSVADEGLEHVWPKAGADYDVDTIGGTPNWSDISDDELTNVIVSQSTVPQSNRLGLITALVDASADKPSGAIIDSVGNIGRTPEVGNPDNLLTGMRLGLTVGTIVGWEIPMTPLSSSPADTVRMESCHGVSTAWVTIAGTERDVAAAGFFYGNKDPTDWSAPLIGDDFTANNLGNGYCTVADITSNNGIFHSVLTGFAPTDNKSDNTWWFGNIRAKFSTYCGADALKSVKFRKNRWNGSSQTFEDIGGSDVYDFSDPGADSRFSSITAVTDVEPLYIVESPSWDASADAAASNGAGIAVVSTGGTATEVADQYLLLMAGVIEKVDGVGNRLPGFSVGAIGTGGLSVLDHLRSTASDADLEGFRSDIAVMTHLRLLSIPKYLFVHLGYNTEPGDLVANYPTPVLKDYFNDLLDRYEALYSTMAETVPTFILMPPVPHTDQTFTDRRCKGIARLQYEISVARSNVAFWNGTQEFINEATAAGEGSDVVGFMANEGYFNTFPGQDLTHMTAAGHTKHMEALDAELLSLLSASGSGGGGARCRARSRSRASVIPV